MDARYYLDTSIWRDFFEERDEPNFPKTTIAHQLLVKTVLNDCHIIVSDMVVCELESAGYAQAEVENLFAPLKPVLLFVEATEKQVGKAKDLAAKRDVPKGDALHALIARDQKAVLVTYDGDFQKLLDIAKAKTPRELI
ncbi:type II toxin-antitoxin system VapC family toxin [Candidatus Woesearchaeota archaeon]|nr:type II toxin-antitoxin system VapC family toxin [Candidatus Woesearchaeota archaeon]